MAEASVISSARRYPSPTGLQSRTDFIGSVARFWARSYAPDYIAIAIILILFILIQIFVTPFHRLFFINDLSISYPHAEVERVDPLWLLIYALLVPLGFLILWTITFKPGAHKARVTFLGLLLSVFLTGLFTDIIKNAVGRPRPDLLARCMPEAGTPENKLVDWHVCTQENHHVLHDGWRSFPSGHSSFAFSGLGYIALFLASQLHAFDPATPLILSLVPFVPLFGAALIAISRTEDYRHDVWDVCAGSILGMLVAYGSWRRYYPHLRSVAASTPHAARGDLTNELKKKEKRRDEEERVGLREDELEEDEDDRRMSPGQHAGR